MKEKASKLEKVVSIVLCVIFVPIILINVTMIVSSYINPNHLPSVFGISPAITLSGSMSPTFDTGSLIFIKDADPDTLKQGDIICYLENGQTAVTHRIAEVVVTDGVKSFITKGDANNTTDAMSVQLSQVEGSYIGHWAGAGNVVMFMQSTTGMILFIALPIAIYLAFDFFLSRKEKKKASDRTAELEAELAALKARRDKEEE